MSRFVDVTAVKSEFGGTTNKKPPRPRSRGAQLKNHVYNYAEIMIILSYVLIPKNQPIYSIRMNKIAKEEIKKHAQNANMTIHDFIFTRCATPEDRELNLEIELVKRKLKP